MLVAEIFPTFGGAEAYSEATLELLIATIHVSIKWIMDIDYVHY